MKRLQMLLICGAILAPSSVFAQVVEATIQIQGVACPFCVYGIEKKIKTVEGVKGIDYDLKSGKGKLQLTENTALDVKAIPRAIQDAGFTLEGIKLTAIGTVMFEDEIPLLSTQTAAQRFVLFESEDEEHYLDNEMKSKLTRYANQKTRLSVSGAVHLHEEGPPGLAIHRIKEIDEKEDGNP